MNPESPSSTEMAVAGCLLVLLVWLFAKPPGSSAGSSTTPAGGGQATDEKAAAEAEEMAFVSDATRLLPDLDKVMAMLLSRYGWEELIDLLSLNRLHMDLLLMVGSSDYQRIELPNMESRSPTAYERQLFHSAAQDNRHNPSYQWDLADFGPSVAVQVPTVQHLEHLIDYGFAVSRHAVNPSSREYDCALTAAGRGALSLHLRYRKKSQWDRYFGKTPGHHARSAVAALMHEAVRLAGQP